MKINYSENKLIDSLEFQHEDQHVKYTNGFWFVDGERAHAEKVVRALSQLEDWHLTDYGNCCELYHNESTINIMAFGSHSIVMELA